MRLLRLVVAWMMVAALLTTGALANASPVAANVLLENYQEAAFGGSIAGTEVYEYGTGTQHRFDDAADFASGTRAGDALAVGDTVTLSNAPLGWWHEDWASRQCVDVSASSAIAQYPFRVVVDTSSGTAEDVRVVAATNPAASAAPLPHYVESGYGTANTIVWFRAPATVAASRFCVYFDSIAEPSTSNDIAPFAYDSGQTVSYYTMLDSYRGNGVNSAVTVVSYSDSNVVSDGTTTVTLNTGQMATFTGLDEQAIITATGPIDGSANRASKDALVPEGFADSQFSFPTSRYVERFWVRSPHQTTTIDVLVDGVVLQSVLVTPGMGAVEITQQAGSGNAYVSLRSTGADFLAIHAATNDQDIGIGVPWFGDTMFGVGSTRFQAGTTADTTVSWFDSTGASGTDTVTTSTLWRQTGNGSYGSGPAHAISSANYFVAWQQADSNGTEVTSFLPERLLAQTYRIPVTTSRYVTVACPVPGTLVTLNGTTRTCNGTGVGHTFFGYGSLAAGSLLTADHPVFVYYETSADEHNLFGPKSAIPYMRSQQAVLGPVEALGEPCGSWTSPTVATSGVFGLTSIDLVGATTESFEVSFDAGAFGPAASFVDYAFDNASTAQIRVTWCGGGSTLSLVGIESDLTEVATGQFGSSIVAVDVAGPALRVYPTLSTSWLAGTNATGGADFEIDTDQSPVQVTAAGGAITNASPTFASRPYTVSIDASGPQTSSIDLTLFDDGSSVQSQASLSLAITIP